MKSINIVIIFLWLFPLVAGSQSFESDNELLYSLNSPFDENYIIMHPNKKQLAFVRGNYPYNQGGRADKGDIWMSNFDSSWQVAKDWHQVNSEHFSSPIGWTNDGSTFLYNLVKTNGGTLITEIWALSDNRTKQMNVQFFENKSEHQSACLSSDNRYIIISMESGATEGVEDLYVITRDGDKWSAPKNLGTVINTEFQEITPFLSPDMRTLYFATNGRKGYGSFDIYSSERLDDTWRNWTTPINLGPAVNSSGRETSFTYAMGSDYAYFISTRNSDGYGDIRRVKFLTEQSDNLIVADTTRIIERESIVAAIGLELINAKTSEPISGKVGLTIRGSESIKIADNQGIIVINQNDLAEVSVQGYMNGNIQLEVDKLVSLRLEPLEVGRTIRLESVLFIRGSDAVMESSFGELDRVVAMMKNNPEIRILLKGHTDGNGDKAQNVKLSQVRVETVKKYLVAKGIQKKRIEGVGLGDEDPIASNETEETRMLNRRVEFEVIH